uniref:Putative facilitated trehalose transporter tret1 n=1 Tax=Corethrella appendiculata TaxID=1370023 RepID=U5ESV2_9DIPT
MWVYLNQSIATAFATLLVVSTCLAYSWISPALKILLSPETPIAITSDESSWIASFIILGSIFGSICTGYLSNKIGRKYTMIIGAVPIICAWIIVYLAKSVIELYLFRILSGIGFGISLSIMTTYLGEISSKNIRGVLTIMGTIMVKFGTMLAYSIGSYVSFYTFPQIAIVFPIIFLLTFVWMPESPHYLLSKGRYEEAEKNWKWLNIKESFDEVKAKMLTDVEENKKLNSEDKNDIKSELFHRDNRNSFFILFAMSTAQAFSGHMMFLIYAHLIFGRVEGFLSADVSTIMLGVTQFVSTILSTFFVDRLGRRPLILFSSFGGTFCTGLVGAYFFFEQYEYNVKAFNFIPVLSLVLFLFFYNIGLGSAGFTLQAEIFPTNIRGTAASIGMVYNQVLAFVLTKLFQVLADLIGFYSPFWLFCSVSAIFLIILYSNIIETKQKRFDEILCEMKALKIRIFGCF